MDLLTSLLREYGLSISGKTKIFYKFCTDLWAAQTRGHEIMTWLQDNPGHDRFVILDDDIDIDDQSLCLIRTNSYEGLQDEHVEQAIRMLKGGDAP